MIHIAEFGVDHGQAFEVVADGQFVRHAHTAMDLDRLLANKAAALADARAWVEASTPATD